MKIKKILAWALTLATLMSLAACGGKKAEAVDGNALLQVMLDKVQFDTPISDVGEDAQMYFSGMPDGAVIKMYTGSGYYADRLALITVADTKDVKTAKASVQEHVEQLRHQFLNYIK